MTARLATPSTAAGVIALLASACTVTTGITGSDGSAPPNNTMVDSGTSSMPEAAVPDAGTLADQSVALADASPPSDDAIAAEASTVPGDAAAVGNGCSDPPANNQSPATASPLTIGTPLRACLRSGTDVNFYSYTVPTSPVKGGYVIVKVSDVDLHNTVDLTTQPASDGATLVHASDGTAGGGVVNLFAAKPGATFRAVVKNLFVPAAATPQTAYTLTVTFTGVNDPSAPNGTVATAATMTPGAPVQGYFFAGHDSIANPLSPAWESWFKITLTAGTPTIALTNVSSDITGAVELFDANTKSIARDSNPTSGGNVQFNGPVVTAGDYYLRVNPLYLPGTTGTTPTVPTYMTQPWTFTVTVH